MTGGFCKYWQIKLCTPLYMYLFAPSDELMQLTYPIVKILYCLAGELAFLVMGYNLSRNHAKSTVSTSQYFCLH